MRRLLTRAISRAMKFFAALATLIVSVFGGGFEVDDRVTSVPRAGSRTGGRSAREEAGSSNHNDFIHGFEYGSVTTEVKTLAGKTVAVSVDPFWLGCPGPPNLIA